MARTGTVTADVAASAALDAAGNSSTEATITDNTVVYTDGTAAPAFVLGQTVTASHGHRSGGRRHGDRDALLRDCGATRVPVGLPDPDDSIGRRRPELDGHLRPLPALTTTGRVRSKPSGNAGVSTVSGR
jgi:hypothetical protein